MTLGGDHIAFVCVGGPPHISDLDRGKRNGTLEDTRNIIKLNQHFDVIHIQSPNVEPQDVPLEPPPFAHDGKPVDARRPSRSSSFRAARRRCATRSRWCGSARGLTPDEFCGEALLLHRHQHQFAAPARYSDVPGHHRFRARRASLGDHALHIVGRDGAGDDCRRADAPACRSARRHHA